MGTRLILMEPEPEQQLELAVLKMLELERAIPVLYISKPELVVLVPISGTHFQNIF